MVMVLQRCISFRRSEGEGCVRAVSCSVRKERSAKVFLRPEDCGESGRVKGGEGGGEKGKRGEGHVQFPKPQRSIQQKPAQRSRPIACRLARLELYNFNMLPKQHHAEGYILLIPSCRVRAVLKGILRVIELERKCGSTKARVRMV